ncbi:MAG: hypothetical protein IJK81_00885 [Selenomonadaceae bacterium]|nr:hypothetical protein [Selenomonadaceae bacterium]
MFGRYDDKSFREQLEKNLSWLRREILNLDDYVPREEFDSLREREDSLREREKTLSREKNSLQVELATSTRRLEAAEKNCRDLERSLEKISAECDYYREAYAELDAAYKNYLSLNEKIRYQLAGIFGDAQTVQGFLIGAANEKHLNDFWDYLRYSLNDNRISNADSKILTELFDFCFDALNNSSREPIYSRLNTERGSRFNSSTMTRTSNSRQLGRVQSVLLEGYADRVGNIIRQSLVFIAD